MQYNKKYSLFKILASQTFFSIIGENLPPLHFFRAAGGRLSSAGSAGGGGWDKLCDGKVFKVFGSKLCILSSLLQLPYDSTGSC